MIKKVSLVDKLSLFDETWVPKIVGELHGQLVKGVKFKGAYVWHSHENEDELFLVIKGQMNLHLRDKVVDLAEGEFCIVPAGVDHKPVAEELCHVLLFEPASTRNTGEVSEDRTIEPQDLQRI